MPILVCEAIITYLGYRARRRRKSYLVAEIAVVVVPAKGERIKVKGYY